MKFGIVRMQTSEIRDVGTLTAFLTRFEQAYRGAEHLDQALLLAATGHVVRSQALQNGDDFISERFSLEEAVRYIEAKWDSVNRMHANYPREIPSWKSTGSLRIVSLHMNSPGDWSFLGSINPLEVLRQYLNDRHQRKLDVEYRSNAEQRRLELQNTREMLINMKLENEIVESRLELARRAGASPEQLRKVADQLVLRPLKPLADMAEVVDLVEIEPIRPVGGMDPIYGALVERDD